MGHKDAQQQSHTLANGLEMSAEAEEALIPSMFETVARRVGAETNAPAALSRQGRDVSMVSGSRSGVARKTVKKLVPKKPTPKPTPKRPTPKKPVAKKPVAKKPIPKPTPKRPTPRK